MGVLDGKAVIVTGGAGTLGRAFARAIAAAGARLVVNDLAGERAEAVVAELEGEGSAAIANAEPVDDWQAAGRLVAACVEAYGRVDGLVCCAHKVRFGPIWSLRESDLDRTVSSHVKGHFACVHHASRVMIEQGSGSIVTMGSRALNGLPGVSTYGAVKGAIMSATFSWALELAEHGIRVNCLNPAAELSGGEPARHMRWHWDFSVDQVGWSEPVPSAESVAPLAVYLLSDRSDWVTGQVIFLSGDTLALLRHPREERFAFRPDGWSVADLEAHFREALGSSLEMPGMGEPRYAWYDGVGKK